MTKSKLGFHLIGIIIPVTHIDIIGIMHDQVGCIARILSQRMRAMIFVG